PASRLSPFLRLHLNSVVFSFFLFGLFQPFLLLFLTFLISLFHAVIPPSSSVTLYPFSARIFVHRVAEFPVVQVTITSVSCENGKPTCVSDSSKSKISVLKT